MKKYKSEIESERAFDRDYRKVIAKRKKFNMVDFSNELFEQNKKTNKLLKP
jgi:hypothetical protein